MHEQDIIEMLNRLIVVSKDGEFALRGGARRARSCTLRSFLERRADDCARAAEELRRLGLQNGATALERYREALDEPLPGPLRERIELQYLGALRHRALMRAWCERGRAASA